MLPRTTSQWLGTHFPRRIYIYVPGLCSCEWLHFCLVKLTRDSVVQKKVAEKLPLYVCVYVLLKSSSDYAGETFPEKGLHSLQDNKFVCHVLKRNLMNARCKRSVRLIRLCRWKCWDANNCPESERSVLWIGFKLTFSYVRMKMLGNDENFNDGNKLLCFI